VRLGGVSAVLNLRVLLPESLSEHRLRASENRAEEKVSTQLEVTGASKEFRDEGLHNLYSSAYIIRTIELKHMR
jgi:hypothetical protein